MRFENIYSVFLGNMFSAMLFTCRTINITNKSDIIFNMEDLNDVTIKTYRDNFKKYTDNTPNEVSGDFKHWIDYFISHLPKNASVLELGSATGRDARYFASKGLAVTCTDIIPEALEKLSSEGFETSEYDFRNEPSESWHDCFDGVFANAVLLHAPDEILWKSLANIFKILKTGGAAGISFKNGDGQEISNEKMDAPRYFKYHRENEIIKLLSTFPFEIAKVEQSENEKWIRIVLLKK